MSKILWNLKNLLETVSGFSEAVRPRNKLYSYKLESSNQKLKIIPFNVASKCKMLTNLNKHV